MLAVLCRADRGRDVDDGKTIAWVLPHEGYDDEALLAPLRSHGFRVATCLTGGSGEVEAGLRVLQAELFADARRLRREYVMDPRPTLIVVASAEQEVDALEFIKPRDDVVRGTQPIELLVMRLLRLAKDASGEALLPLREITDELTGLPNRRRWAAQVEQALAQDLPGECRAVVMFDLDGFKQVNDRWGHDIGDELLVAVGQRLQSNLRGSDVVARLGGDEFVVTAAGLADEGQARDLGAKLVEAFRTPFALSGERRIEVGLTIGYVLVPLDGLDPVSLLRQADAAMYAGKQRGKGCCVRRPAVAGYAGSV
jgi:diguanylate cyclase (GGDEF)-like protein